MSVTVTTAFTENNGRQGGDCYTSELVAKLKRGTEAHSPYVVRFDPVVRWNMSRDWPGWWSKIELFRPGRFAGMVLYMDLDTLPVGDLAGVMSYRGDFCALRDFYHPGRLQSSVMMWRPGPQTDAIWRHFTENPDRAMRKHRSDQEFIEHVFREEGYAYDRWQDELPGAVVSLKVHARAECPEGAALVCGHGDPRFSSQDAGWAHDLWASR